MDTEWIDGRLAAIHRGRKWILAGDVAAALTGLTALLRRWGAADLLVVAAGAGVGDLPGDVEVVYTGTAGETIMSSLRAFLRALEAPTPELQAAIDRFDPEGVAHVIAPPFATQLSLLDRPVHGGRRPEWVALEDKTQADAIWDGAGIPRAPIEIVVVDEAPGAASRLASPHGTVWVADNSQGWHGGGDYTRWVATPADARSMVAWFRERAERVRVMPFLEGIPASIHGFVTDTGSAAFRPVEMVILRSTDSPGFVYAGCSTLWDPPPVIRAEMRSAARRVGAYLHETVGYLGGFSIDGVCTSDGFMPTELNPRVSAGLGMQAMSAEISIGTINRGLVAGELEVDAEYLEEVVVAAADRNRIAGMGLPVRESIAPERISLRFRDEGVELAPADDADAAVEVGPTPTGSYIRMRVDTARIAPGQSVAPYAARAASFFAARWGLELPAVQPAPDVWAGELSRPSPRRGSGPARPNRP